MAERKPTAERKAWVLDTTATPEYPTRVHEIFVEGKRIPVTFKFGERLEMPLRHAQKFIPIASFEVYDENEDRLKPATSVNKGFLGAMGTLAEDECVAFFEELSIEALLARAAPLPGGEEFTRNSGKIVIIDFIKQTRKRMAALNAPKPEAAPVLEIEDMGEDDDKGLEALIPAKEVEAA